MSLKKEASSYLDQINASKTATIKPINQILYSGIDETWWVLP